ncbi:zinc-dependent alcohol dehydrogenase family protein [Billgrantia endophytica]|uniref:NAD(P)-dependent alcohol dehydrogenase n=1 Tax=Billgrantia endophytica TaxID=2033802 RepID=A0A2N7TXR4_9GAMM|nr:NAD(P)-dependent alcohol dehydrogenase [Halomonas endophytica]PMR72973.1 NAD(P)-dependent alcohol dehydrogenase [Halomonas endophytica]
MHYYAVGDSGGLIRYQAEAPRPGPGQVLVRMHAAALNHRDLLVASGRYALGKTPENLVPLSDGAGEVVEVGDDVTRVSPGDRVAATFVQQWIAGEYEESYAGSALGGGCHGVLREYAVFDQHGLVELPSHLSFQEGCTLPCAGVTAWNALFGNRPIQPGDAVLILGTGGVSLFALQFAKLAGARVVATSSSEEKLATLDRLGANDTINYSTHREWHERVLELTGGTGVDHVVEVVGGENVGRSIEATRNGGMVHLIGAQAKGLIDPTRARRRNVTLRGLYVGSRTHFEAMNRAIDWHGIRPVMDRTYEFREAERAYEHLRTGHHVGKVVISFP